MKKYSFLIVSLSLLMFSFTVSKPKKNIENNIIIAQDSNQTIFWQELNKLKGKAFSGTIIAGPKNDTAFTGKNLVMHVRKVEKNKIYIPFFVGNDSSRTWVLTKDAAGILLKHDHRHKDGSPDKVTMYGGKTSNTGSKNRQLFPADQETTNLLPTAIGNIWWIDLVPGEYFSYNLRRVNSDLLFSIKFDLKKETPTPGKPWGFKD
jgi:hypothetical protein